MTNNDSDDFNWLYQYSSKPSENVDDQQDMTI